MAADALVRKFNGSPWQLQGELFLWSKVIIRDLEVAVIKPLTFMNRSGFAVVAALGVFELGLDRLCVVHDDLDLPAGGLRVKFGGGHGGQRGVKSIVESLGSPDFVRVRLGVGRPPPGLDAADHVLGRYRDEEWLDLSVMVERGAAAVETVFVEGPTAAMNQFNRAVY